MLRDGDLVLDLGGRSVEDEPGAPVRLVTVFGRGYRWDRTDPDEE